VLERCQVVCVLRGEERQLVHGLRACLGLPRARQSCHLLHATETSPRHI
jgi:hypothetical protein